MSRIIQVPVNDVSFPGGWRASEQDVLVGYTSEMHEVVGPGGVDVFHKVVKLFYHSFRYSGEKGNYMCKILIFVRGNDKGNAVLEYSCRSHLYNNIVR